MGAVFEAWDLRLDRQVAVKILTGRLFGNQAALRRFEREARTAAKLNHPNIVGIHDFGTLGGGGAYLVMPLIPGRSWRAELDRSTSMQPARLADWCEQLFAAVGEAHAHGVIHRDLKPENVLITDEAEGAEKITVLDFGLAKMRSESWADNALLTTDGMIVGTLGYMSPEQRAGGEVDARADIFTAGVMVVESLSGVRPPTGGATVEWMYATLRWTAPNFATKQLTTLLESCLAAEASARVDRMKAVEQYVVPLLRDCPAAIWLKGSATDGETMVAGI
jgi:serine/threonine-protein kinase